MRGYGGCDFRSFARHCQNMGPFGRGPNGLPGHHHGPSRDGHHGQPGYGCIGLGFFGRRPPGCHFEYHGLFSKCHRGAESENCCPDSCRFDGCERGFGRDPCPLERHHGFSCADFESGPRIDGPPEFGRHGRHHSPEGRRQGPPHCGPRGHTRSRGSHRRHQSQRPCCGPPPPPHHSGPLGVEQGLHHGPGHHGPSHCLGSCERNDHGEREHRGPHGHHGCEGFGPHRRPFGPWNLHGPYGRCQRRSRPSDDESGNETERTRKNRPSCSKNKEHNRDETVLVQRIVAESVPRCNSV